MGNNNARVNRSNRRGSIIVLSAILMVVLLGMIAFAIDLGYIMNSRTELQRAADSAAMAGAGALINGTTEAQADALKYVGLNKIGGRTLTSSNATVEFGTWASATRTFTPTNTAPNAVRVSTTLPGQPMFFGKVFGQNTFTTSAKAIAVYQPRDIALVLDYSGSMCYDSQFRSIGLLGQTAIEANLLEIYNELGKPTYGKLKFTPVAYGNSSTSNSSVKSNFNLTNVAYPYPGGSWDEYIDYVQTNNDVQSAGYQNKYGYMTWLNYILSQQNTYADTPGLASVSEQPITALKDAVDSFLAYLKNHSTDDRVALSIYTYSDNTAKLESGLTKTYTTISNLCRTRQAGHYVGGTNISAGMTKGRLELQNNGRAGAQKMMLLMTDGVVNLPSGNSSSDKAAVIAEANLCATAKIPIMTISVGSYADTSLMKQVANITDGAAFVIPGGQPVSAVEKQLEEVFGKVAADRPLKLVQ